MKRDHHVREVLLGQLRLLLSQSCLRPDCHRLAVHVLNFLRVQCHLHLRVGPALGASGSLDVVRELLL